VEEVTEATEATEASVGYPLLGGNINCRHRHAEAGLLDPSHVVLRRKHQNPRLFRTIMLPLVDDALGYGSENGR